MRAHVPALAVTALVLLAGSLGCGDGSGSEGAGTLVISDADVTKVDPGKTDTSAEAIFVDFEFDGELITDATWRPESQVEDQLLYTIGQLNGDNAVGRLDQLVLSNVTSEAVDGRTRVSYHAKMPVAWGKRDAVPAEYKLRLPKDMSHEALQAFSDAYSHDCVDFGAHDVDPGSMWYYFRPAAYRCSLAPEDIVVSAATVTVSPINTNGKYPEYHRIWEDGVFRVVAVFGKYEDDATSGSDAGIAAYNRFHTSISELLGAHELTTDPTDPPRHPGVDVPEIAYRATIDAAHEVVVHALMVDNVRTAGVAFDRRYGELSSDADLVIYNGHAGLGANIRALARKGEWIAGQYVMVFMNGCDTYAYVDSALFDAHAAVNPDDPTGTQHTDILTNALPSRFASMANASMALIRSILRYDEPSTYQRIFEEIDSSQVVLVSGEEDNEYVPGFGDDDLPPPVDTWPGLSEAGTSLVGDERRFATPTLPVGTYIFEMTGTGDADLHIRVGSAPTSSSYDCRPYKSGSNETCQVDLPSPAVIHGMVQGYAASSTWELTGRPL